MVDELMYNLKQAGLTMISLEGGNDSDWILLDLGDIIVHLIHDMSRDVYDLDDLWKDLEQVEIPQEYYFGEGQEKLEGSKSDTENYF